MPQELICTAHVEAFKKDLANSKSSLKVTKFSCLDHCPTEPSLDEENTACLSTSFDTAKQRFEAWFSERVGKITSSKAPTVIGLYGKKEFCETWDCIKNKLPEETKNFRNFQRGITYEDDVAACLSAGTGATLSEYSQDVCRYS